MPKETRDTMKNFTYPSIKIDFIDEQHEAIFEIIDDLSVGISKHITKEALRSSLFDLVSKCTKHFDAEESLLNQYHFSDLTSHIEAHNGFKQKLNDLIKIYDDGRYELSVDTIHFLSDWLITHITSSDKTYEPYIHSKIHHTA